MPLFTGTLKLQKPRFRAGGQSPCLPGPREARGDRGEGGTLGRGGRASPRMLTIGSLIWSLPFPAARSGLYHRNVAPTHHRRCQVPYSSCRPPHHHSCSIAMIRGGVEMIQRSPRCPSTCRTPAVISRRRKFWRADASGDARPRAWPHHGHSQPYWQAWPQKKAWVGGSLCVWLCGSLTGWLCD